MRNNLYLINRRGLSVLLLVLFEIVLSNSVWAKQLYAVGKAYSLNGKQLLYIENHYVEFNFNAQLETSQTVVYLEPTGDVFAEKILDFSHSPIMPSFRQYNSRIGELIEINNTKANEISVLYRKATNHKPKNKVLAQSDTLVIDAGFDNLVRSQWQALNSEQTLTFEYLIPSMRRAIKLDIKKVNCNLALTCFSISPNNRFLSFFTGKLELHYNPDTKRLETFRGKGNIAGSDGKYQQVSIHYQYFDLKAT